MWCSAVHYHTNMLHLSNQRHCVDLQYALRFVHCFLKIVIFYPLLDGGSRPAKFYSLYLGGTSPLKSLQKNVYHWKRPNTTTNYKHNFPPPFSAICPSSCVVNRWVVYGHRSSPCSYSPEGAFWTPFWIVVIDPPGFFPYIFFCITHIPSLPPAVL